MVRVGYARVSSREQALGTHALDQQCRQLEVFGCDEIYVEVGRRSDANRPEFRRLLHDCENGLIDEVVVVRVDRFSGNVLTLRESIAQLQACGASFISLSENIDTKTAAGQFQLTMLGALAEMEVGRLAERVKDGWGDLRSQRRAVASVPFGYRRVADRFEPHDEPWLCLLTDYAGDDVVVEGRSRWVVARDLIELFLSEESLGGCLSAFSRVYGFRLLKNCPRGRHSPPLSRTGLGSFLRNPATRGHIAYRTTQRGEKLPAGQWWIAERDRWPALVSESEHFEICRVLDFNAKHKSWGGKKRSYPLSGLLVCDECGHSLNAVRAHTGRGIDGLYKQQFNYYFQCPISGQDLCDQRRMIRMDVAEETLIYTLCEHAEEMSVNLIIEEEPIEPTELRELRSQLRVLNEAGYNPAIEVAKNEIQRQIDTFFSSLGDRLPLDSTLRDDFRLAFSSPEFFLGLDADEKRCAFRRFIVEARVRDREVVLVELAV